MSHALTPIEPNPRRRNPKSVAATNKRRGAMVERVVADYLALHTGLPVERRRLEGVLDRGDLAGIPGVVVEIKSGQPNIGAWLRETERERRNANAQIGVLWWAPPGLAKTPARHVAIVEGDEAFTKLNYVYTCGAIVKLDVPASKLSWHCFGTPGIAAFEIAETTYAQSGHHAATCWDWKAFT